MSKRIEWIDYAKGFTILSVILMHVLVSINYNYLHFTVYNIVGLVISTFMMPVFFALSGFLYKNISGFKEYIFLIYKKFSSFFIPYFLTSILFILIFTNKISTLLVLKLIIVPTGHTWFLYSLFLIFIIYGAMDLLKLNIVYKFIITMIMFVSSKFIPSISLGVPLVMPGIRLTCLFMPYFFLGYLLNNYVNINYFFENKIKCAITITLTAVSLFTISVLFHYNLISAEFGINNIIPKILLIIVLFKLFIIIPKNRLYRFIEYNGENSIIIYLIHYFFARSIGTQIQYIMGVNDLTAIISIIVAFSISYVISLLVVFLCNYRALRWIFFPREFIDPAVKNTKLGKWMFP